MRPTVESDREVSPSPLSGRSQMSDLPQPSQAGLNLSGPTKVAVVGAGFIADFHLAVLTKTPGVEVIAVCDTVEERAAAAAKKHGVAGVATDLAQLPGMGVQVAHLTTPPDLHVSLTKALLELGLGVFVEKPLALCSADARELVDLAQARDLPLAVNHNNVFAPAFARLLERVEAGEIGRVEHVRVTLSVPLRQLDAGDYSHWMFRSPRNIVFEQVTHPISQIEALIGAVESTETTLLSTRELNPGQEFHDRWLVAAKAERGTAELYLAFGQDFTRSTLEVIGTDGSLEADMFHDHLSGERKTVYLDFYNSFLAGTRRARGLRHSAWRVMLGWMGFTLGVAGRKDAFYVGMRDSIQSFHGALRSRTRLPGDGPRAVAVADWCESVGRDVAAEAPPAPEIPEPGEPREGEVVVTGASGFIGRRVVRKLLERGVPVTAISRRKHALCPEILDPILDGRVRLVQTSLEDEEGLAQALKGSAVCIHLATGGGDDWETVERYMVRGSERVGEICMEQNVGRLIYVSSVAALYGGPDAGVKEISDNGSTDPAPDARPLYARGKMAAEEALLALHKSKGLPVTIARPGVVLGAGSPMQHSGIGLWVRDNHCVGWGKGHTPLPLVWVDDVAEALVRAALHEGDDLEGRAWNLCARPPLSAADMVEELRKHTGRKLYFHSRSLWVSQAMEIGKWVVKKVGRRPGAAFPSWRDLKSRSLAPPFRCEVAREILGWTPVEEREAFLDAAVRVHR